jgi:Protein of unknown function (DUF2924)
MPMNALSAQTVVIPDLLNRLTRAERSELLSLWHDLVGRPAPANLSVPFLRRALAFELQCNALGAPKPRSVADVERIAKGRASITAVGARLQPGARLIREWQGRTWTVEVTEAGLMMAGERYQSLSAIARRITGAHWSGPRFFGLKSGAEARDGRSKIDYPTNAVQTHSLQEGA